MDTQTRQELITLAKHIARLETRIQQLEHQNLREEDYRQEQLERQ